MLHTLLHNLHIITKCRNRYYKMPSLLQNAQLITKCVGWIYCKMLHTLLHNLHIITKCRNRYYKMPSLLQNAQLITKCAAHFKMRRYYKMPQNNVLKANKFALEASLLGQIIVLRTSNFLEATISRLFLDRSTLYIVSIFAEKKKHLFAQQCRT